MNSNRNLPACGWSAGFSWYAVLLLLLIIAFPRTATGEEPSGPPIVVLGTLESTSIKYQGVGKTTGASYKGTARVKVLEVLGGKDREPGGIPSEQQVLVVWVEEPHKKPTWETKKGQRFIFVLDSIVGSSQFRVVDVGNADEATVQNLRVSGHLRTEQLRKILHPNDPT